MKDPYGAVLTLIRDDTTAAAIHSGKVASEFVPGEAPPLVVLVELATTRRPFGPGSGRIGMQGPTYIARCYGPDTPTGKQTARQLAGAVSDALHGVHWAHVGTAMLAEVQAPELDGVTRDPDTRWPYVSVRVDVKAMANAVA